MAATMVGRALTASPKFEFSQCLPQVASEPKSLVTSISSFLQILNPQSPNASSNLDPSILNQFSPHLTPSLVTQVIKSQTNPYHALFFYHWASNPNPNPNNYAHTHHCYIAITDLLISHNLFSVATNLLESSNKLSDFMVGKFIKAHGDLGHVRWAMKLFRDVKMKESGRCLFSYNAILGVLVKANRVDLAKDFYDQMKREGMVKPDVSTYTTMIKGFIKIGMIESAQKVFDEMACEPNMVTYNTIINGFCKKGLMDCAGRVYDRMMQSNDCLPDTVTYTTLIDGYCKKGQLDEARGRFDEMLSRNCEPNMLTYNAFINGLCLRGNVDEARRMMTRMRLNGLKDNVATHTSLLKGYCIVGRSGEAVKHLKEMISLGMEPDVKAYEVVVNEFCKMWKPNEAIALLHEMTARGLKPSAFSFNVIFRILVGSMEFDRAVHLLKQMPRMGCYPNFLSYSTVICGLVRAKGRMLQVQELLGDMSLEGHSLDVTLYSNLVQGYCGDGNVEMAIHVFQEMVNKSYVINLESFSVFVKELCAKGKVFKVDKFFEQMTNSCPATVVDSYRKVFDEFLCRSNTTDGG